MNPNDPRQNQDPNQPQDNQQAGVPPVLPPPQPTWFTQDASGMSEEDFHRERIHFPLKKLFTRLGVLIAALAIIGGTLYGVFYFNQESKRLASEAGLTKTIVEAAYTGDGTDIEKITQPTITYNCPVGFVKTDAQTDCKKQGTVTVSAANYACAPGYVGSGSGSSFECSKIEGGSKEVIAALTRTTCDGGFTVSGANCTKKEQTSKVKNYGCKTAGFETTGEGDGTQCVDQKDVSGTLNATCPSGYVKGGSGASTTCTQTVLATKKVTYTCPAGYSVAATCSKNAAYVKTPYCPSGIVKGGSCYSITGKPSHSEPYCSDGKIEVGACWVTTNTVGRNQVCPSGYTYQSWGPCAKKVGSIKYRTVYDKCPSGYPFSYDATHCYTTSPSGKWPTKTVYNCNGQPSGVSLNGSKCQKTAVTHVAYSCASGFTPPTGTANCTRKTDPKLSCSTGYKQVGNKCVKTTTVTQPPVVTEVCPGGYSDVAGGCFRTVTVPGGQGRYCKDGTYKLVGAQCERIVGGTKVKAAPTVTYSCPAGYTQEGEGDKMKCSKEDVQSQPAQKDVRCDEGWLKRLLPDGDIDCVFVKQSAA